MPLQNRVSPFGTIEAVAARGLLTGNRGILHDAARRLGRARWRHKSWIACRLDFGTVRRVPMSPGSWTELFFLDEAVALAAGHRPCAYCRRADFGRFAQAFCAGLGLSGAPRAEEIDRVLHAARIEPGSRVQRTFEADGAALPDGCFVGLGEGEAWLVSRPFLLRWTHHGYDARAGVPDGAVRVLTPAPTVAALRAGYRPMLHASAGLAPAAGLG
ncbi:MAG TPA: hypothetical protein PKA13_21735 [Geminicoccaceae bacterium]|nr:hypothetical protein [Geminicoccus sp.]HMU52416.1 hypothetical protein [Geminicoccaceae bacterium]